MNALLERNAFVCRGLTVLISLCLSKTKKGIVIVHISQTGNGASRGNKVLAVMPGANRALGADDLLLSGGITLGAGPAGLSGREPNKNVLPLGYLLCMTHDCGFTLFLLIISFY